MKKNLIALLFGLFLVVTFLWSNLTLPAVNITPAVGTNDFTDTHYPSRFYYAEFVKTGQLPLWSSILSSGYPLMAAAQIYLYPPNLLLALLPPTQVVILSLLLDYFLIFLFSFLYLRKIHLGRESALFGASISTFGGFSASGIIYPDLLVTFYLFLAQLYILEVFLQKGGKNLIWILVMGLVLGLQMITGHPQTTFYGLLFLFFYWGIFWFLKKRNIFHFFFYVAIFVSLGLGIGAAQIFPEVEFIRSSTRAAGLTSESILRYNFSLPSLVTFIRPFSLFDNSHTLESFAKNGWPTDDRYVYVGLGGLAFILLGLSRLLKSGKYAILFAFSAATGMIFSFGNQFPLVGYLQVLPPFSLFRLPFKILFLVNFSLAVIAAYGFSRLGNTFNRLKIPKVFTLVTLVLIIFLNFADLKINAEKLHPPVDIKKWYKDPEVVSFLKENLQRQERVTTQYYYYPSIKIYLSQPELWGKVEVFSNLRNLLPALNNFMYEIPLNVGIANAGALKISRYNELEAEIFYKGVKYNEDLSSAEVSSAFLFLNRLTGVKYAIFAQPVKNESLKKVFETNFTTGQDQVSVYELADYYPRVFIVPKAEKADARTIKNHLLAGDFNPREKVFVEEEAELTGGKTEAEFIATAQIETYTDYAVYIKTQSNDDGFLFLSDTYYPGWKATVDGKETKILRANYAFRAMSVPKGEHKVVLQFNSESFNTGLKVTVLSIGATIGGILFLLGFAVLRKKKS